MDIVYTNSSRGLPREYDTEEFVEGNWNDKDVDDVRIGIGVLPAEEIRE
jgi:hypothetical protein